MRRLRLASFLDRLDSKIQRHAERLNPEPAWFREFRSYLGDPRMTIEEFWIGYTLLRNHERPKMRAVSTSAAAHEYFATSDYPLWRNLVHRRHSAWRRVLWTMSGKHGRLLEIGCGIAPVSAWVAPRKPGWRFGLQDVPGAASLKYANHRLREQSECFCSWSVTTALDVFEHLAHPVQSAERAVKGLLPGGYLHWNFVETDGTQLDLATADQRRDTIAYLRSALRVVYEEPGYIVSQRP